MVLSVSQLAEYHVVGVFPATGNAMVTTSEIGLIGAPSTLADTGTLTYSVERLDCVCMAVARENGILSKVCIKKATFSRR